MFGSKWEDVTGDWRDMHNEEPCNLYSFTHTIWGDENIEDEKHGACVMYGRDCKCI
jgi:hypothetical protein